MNQQNTDQNMMSEREKVGKIFFFIMLFCSAIICGIVIYDCFVYEMNHAYTADAPLYWTVGRGMLNGVSPYSGLYENKPIGIFLISALSFFINKNSIFCNIFCFFCLVVIGMSPVVYTAESFRRNSLKESSLTKLKSLEVSIGLGLLLMMYCENRSGGFQVESMGAAFIVLYHLCIVHIQWNSKKELFSMAQIIWTLLAGVFLGVGVMFKEPFLIVAFAGGILLVETWKDFIGKIIIPFFIGGLFSIILLLLTGCVKGYFSIYLHNMFSNHIGIYGSPFDRMLRVDRLIRDMCTFTLCLFLLLFLLFVGNIIAVWNKSKQWKKTGFFIVKLIFAVLLSSFAVGLGGQYYNHHFIFAVPFYMALFFVLFPMRKYCSRYLFYYILPVLIFSFFVTLPKKGVEIKNIDYSERYASIENTAHCVDRLLDYYHEDTYQYLGFNGEDKFFGLTKKSPKGPNFVQDSTNFMDKNNWFSKNMIKQLDEVNIVIIRCLNMPKINQQVNDKIVAEFIEHPKKECSIAKQIEHSGYRIFYRSSKYGVSEQ